MQHFTEQRFLKSITFFSGIILLMSSSLSAKSMNEFAPTSPDGYHSNVSITDKGTSNGTHELKDLLGVTESGVRLRPLSLEDESAADTVVSEEFESDPFDRLVSEWSQVSLSGDGTTWAYRLDDQAVRMNAFPDGCDGDDWLISPSINFTGLEGLSILIEATTQFDGNDVEVFLSNDYDPNTDADPETATLISVATLGDPAGRGPFDFSISEDITEALTGEYQILFHYESTSGCAEWFINSLNITAETFSSSIVQFEESIFLTREGEASVDVSVAIINPDSTTETTVEVALLTDIDGAAGEAADVDGYMTQTLTFPAGSSESQSITFTVTDDMLEEGSESIILELQNATTASIGTISQTVLQIGDNDFELSAISDIQGEGHFSDMEDEDVFVTGVVIGEDNSGFYIQDTDPDANPKTSEALYVFTAGGAEVTVGDKVNVIGTVEEQEQGTNEPTRTQIGNNPFVEIVSSGNELPAPIVIGLGGVLPPTEMIDDGEFDESFDPSISGIDFYESLENMLVTIQDPMAVSPVGFFDVYVVTDQGAFATGISERNTITIGPGDLNPEKIEIALGFNDLLGARPTGATQGLLPGTVFQNITGIVTYDRGVYEVTPTEDFNVVEAKEETSFTPAITEFKGNESELLIATYNVLNLDPNADAEDDDVGEGRFATIADQIINYLNTPDILGLQEIQDNTGSVGPDSVIAADVTLQTLVDAISTAGGPTYEYIDNTFLLGEATSGGDPNGNIRTAFLYNPARVSLIEGSVQTISSQNDGDAFEGARLPLVAEFSFNDTTLLVVNNHFSSKGGSAPIYGTRQPFGGRQEDVSVNGSLDERQVQSMAVQQFVRTYLAESDGAPVVVLGDLNEFEFVSPVLEFEDFLFNLTNKIPENERYTFIFQGNSQTLDHILVSDNLAINAKVQIAHLNIEKESTDASGSDHEPVVALLDFSDLMPLPRDQGQDILVRQISSSTDDAEQYLPGGSRPDNGMDITSSDLELGQESGVDSEFGETFQVTGLRFTDIRIPKNAVIVSAEIEFTVDNTNKNIDPTELEITVEASDDPATYADVDGNITSRTYSDLHIDWLIPTGSWTEIGQSDKDQTTPNLASLVQEIVKRPGWESGNAIAFAFEGNGIREAESWDGSAEDAPRLKINFIPTSPAEFEIAASSDDAEQYLPGGTRPENGMDLSSSDIELGSEDDDTDQISALRFANLEIPQGAIINAASIQFVVDNTSKNEDPAEFYIIVEDSDSTFTYSESVGDISSRTYYNDPNSSADTVYWTVPEGSWTEIGNAGPAEMTTDISSLLQYIVDKEGWKEGNAVSFVIGGTGRREAGSFDSDAPAKLKVDFVPFIENSIKIASSTDDAEQYLPGGSRPDNGMDITSSDLELGQESGVDSEFGETFQLTGLRFTGLELPQGALIESANIQFTVDNISKNIDPTELYIVVEDNADPATYADEDGNITSRSYYDDGVNSMGGTPADTVFWNITEGSWDEIDQNGDNQRTPDISGLLQRIVNRPDWEFGGSVAFVIGGSGIREAESFDGEEESAPVLNFTFAQGGRPAFSPEIVEEIEDIETTQGTFFSVDFNQFFEDKDTPLSFFATDYLGRDLPDEISITNDGVLRGVFDRPVYQAVRAFAESFGDTIYQEFNIIVQPQQSNVLTQLSSLQVGTAFDEGAAEISAFDPLTNKLYVTNSEVDAIEVIDLTDPTSPTKGTPIDISTLGGGVNSVAVADGLLAVAIEADVKQDSGFVYIYNTTDESLQATYTVGALPDMVTFNKDASVIVVANEGEPSDDYTVDPEGSISIITLPADLANASQEDVATADFTAFNGMEETLKAEGVRIFGPDATVAQDLEPEYITIQGDSAYVTLQENNAVAIVSISTATVEDIFGLGYKDHSLAENGIDPSKDEDLPLYIDNGLPLKGLYMPDAIASIKVGDKTYLLTANEGDAREYIAEVDEATCDDLNGEFDDGECLVFTDETEIGDIELDPNFFPDAEFIEEVADGLGITTTSKQSADGKYQELMTFGARSFTIWDLDQGRVYDSGDDFEQITASLYPENFNASDDDVTARDRSDNKGPEPEAITVGTVGATTYAFIGLERIGGVMIYNITDPLNPEFVEYFNNRDFSQDPEDDFLTAGDNAPEGLVFVPADDSPSGQALLIVSNEVSGTVTTYQIDDIPATPNTFTLELLHVTDQEAGAPAIQDAPRLSAVMNALENEDLGDDGIEDNTLRLSSGDAFIPGLFYDASGDAFGSRGVADIQIQNELEFEAIALGNHEFDFGTEVLAGLVSGNTTTEASFDLTDTDLEGDVVFGGTNFPYLTSNLDFSASAFMSDLAVAGGQSPRAGKVTSSTIVNVNGESIGIVGATTPTLPSISSPDDVLVSPQAFGNTPTDEEIDALAEIIQEEVEALLDINPLMNKIILLAHMQRIDIEFALAEKLENVDIIVAGGSNTRLTDADDRLRDGDTKQGDYPQFFTNAGGTSTAVVNTDGSYKYVGRLVIDFDTDGNILDDSYDASISGVYATDEQGVTDLDAADLVDPEIQAIASAIEDAIVAKESNVFGIANTYLNGNRSGAGTAEDPDGVRTQETNLGNLTADANLKAAQTQDSTVQVSIKNGGGIRASIGQILVPAGATEPVRLPNEAVEAGGETVKPAGGISENDINTTLAFNNGLSLLTLTHQQLVDVIEHGVALLPTVAGQFIQISGVKFSFDPSLDAGSRVRNAVFVNEDGEETSRIVNDGTVLTPDTTVRIVTLNFLAGGGDGYPFPQDGMANRVNLYDLDSDGNNDGATGSATFADDGTEQDALAEYLLDNFMTTPYDLPDAGPNADERIQNLLFRGDSLQPILVDLSVSMTSIEEGGEITITATASKAVKGAKTVNVVLSSEDDASLSSPTITIADGALTGMITLTATDDTEEEDEETVTITLSTPSEGLFLGTTVSTVITITDNDAKVLNASEALARGVRLFPNPTSDLMTIETSQIISKVLIYNLIGQIQEEIPVTGTSIALDLSDYSKGSYLVKLITAKDEQITLRAFKQ